jgi:hypothetical protein
MINVDEVQVWIHTCPQRRVQCRKTCESLERAFWQIHKPARYQVMRHPEGLTPLQIRQWWESQWLEFTDGPYRWTIRLEDDVELNYDFFERLGKWTAVDEPDFGQGLLLPLKGAINHWGVTRNERGNEFCSSRITGAQAQIIETALISAVLKNARLGDMGDYDPFWDFDAGFSEGVVKLGLKNYVHRPGLGSHVGSFSVYANEERGEEFGVDHTSTPPINSSPVGLCIAWGELEECGQIAIESWSRAHGGAPFVLINEQEALDLQIHPLSLIRTRIFDLLPSWCQLGCYVDADTFTQKPWAHLLDMDADGSRTGFMASPQASFGVATDMGAHIVRRVEPPTLWGNYFNSGVFVARREAQRLLDEWLIQGVTTSGFYPDQTALNRAIKRINYPVTVLPQSCNWLLSHGCDSARDGAHLLHWAAEPRPRTLSQMRKMPMPEGPLGEQLPPKQLFRDTLPLRMEASLPNGCSFVMPNSHKRPILLKDWAAQCAGLVKGWNNK